MYDLTKHAQKVLEERKIPIAWVEQTLLEPELTLPDPDDSSLERCFRCIPQFDNRVLRVVVNRTVDPQRVVSVFFDRQMKGKI
jgi:hypothetical protein